LWSIDQYFEFVLVLMFSTGLSFQVKVFLESSAHEDDSYLLISNHHMSKIFCIKLGA
jgi:hypothetical protein